jgi:hypothetical protein
MKIFGAEKKEKSEQDKHVIPPSSAISFATSLQGPDRVGATIDAETQGDMASELLSES